MFEGKSIVTIYSGEYYISSDPQVIIYTLLGSCVAVCLFDPFHGIGGMNHFMLPEALENTATEQGRYGLQSLEMMIDDLLKKGAVFKKLQAKIFGGSKMVIFNHKENDIAQANINFTTQYLDSKRISIVAKGVGGNLGRKIYYQIEDHSVFVQQLNREGSF